MQSQGNGLVARSQTGSSKSVRSKLSRSSLTDQDKRLLEACLDPRIPLSYWDALREYNIPRRYEDEVLGRAPRMQSYNGVSQGIFFCPFSGDLLPGSLRKTWFQTIWRQYGDDFTERPGFWRKLPAELRSERWWLDRRIRARRAVPDFGMYNCSANPEWLRSARLGLPEGVPNRFAPPHLCEWIAEMIGGAWPLRYHAPSRTYGFRILDPDRPLGQQPVRLLAISFCPGCGAPLPPSLEEEWLHQLHRKGLRRNSVNKPRTLATDYWWRRRYKGPATT